MDFSTHSRLASELGTTRCPPHFPPPWVSKKMKIKLVPFLLSSLLLVATSSAFTPAQFASGRRSPTTLSSAVDEKAAAAAEEDVETSSSKTSDPLLIRAAKGQKTERTPVWMMRQAGRHIQEYRELCKKYPTFRQRSEIPEVAVEVSLQPWRNYQTDGCILFSDILTPLPGMGANFEIDEKLGPVMSSPIKSYDDLKTVRDDMLGHFVVVSLCFCCCLMCCAADGVC